MAKGKSFDEFYYRNEDRNVSVKFISDYADKHNGDYNLYRGNMFCPECRAAELILRRKSSTHRAHLKKIPSSCHANDCSYNYEYITCKRAKEFINSLSDEKIQDKLNSMMHMFFDKKLEMHMPKGEEAEQIKSNPMIISHEQPKFIRAFRRKSLSGWFSEDEENKLCVFYGKVKMDVSEMVKDEKTYFRLTLHVLNENNEPRKKIIVFRSWRDNIDKDKDYYIVLIGSWSSANGWKIKLANQKAIKFREIS
ncbi:MAG: hypothetical protein FWD38_04315 [Oscillospiraceae bacterium]|nr:hypothetical protein [Oscillospiraceae bacterium]